MSVLIMVELSELPLLPESIKQRIGFHALAAALSSTAGAPPFDVPQQPAGQPAAPGKKKRSSKKDEPAQTFAPGTEGLPPAQPVKAGVPTGTNATAFPATINPNDPTQRTMGIDLTTNQPAQIGGFGGGFPGGFGGGFPGQQMAAAANAPQMASYPPPTAAPQMAPGAAGMPTKQQVVTTAVNLWRTNSNAVTQALTHCGIPSLNHVDDSNAAILYQALHQITGGQLG